MTHRPGLAGGLRAVLAAVAMTATLAQAGPVGAQTDDYALCRAQAAAVERARGLPPGLLLAVGRVESGRGDGRGGEVPWPWSVNDEGTDHVFRSEFDAIAYVVEARARGSRSLDVGCFQVNLQFHPDAFATLAEAFDPAANARYAGQMLTEFHDRTGSWDKAVQWYHSATPWRGEMYRDRVLSRWEEASLLPPPPQGRTPVALPRSAAAAAAEGAAQAAQGGTGGLWVHVPPATAAATAPTPHARRLPRVIVPSVYAAGR